MTDSNPDVVIRNDGQHPIVLPPYRRAESAARAVGRYD